MLACKLHTVAFVAGFLPFVAALGCSGTAAGVGDGSSGSSGAGSSGSSGAGSSGSSGAGSSGSSGAGSSGSGTAGESFFQAPSGTATPDSIYGLWGGTTKSSGVTFDSRMKVGASSVTLATRCRLDSGETSGIVGVTAAARVTADSFVILESKDDQKNDGAVRCWVSLAPREVSRCAADVQPGFEENCFTVAGTTFTMYGNSSFDAVQLIKLSD